MVVNISLTRPQQTFINALKKFDWRQLWHNLSDTSMDRYKGEWERVVLGVWMLMTLVLTRSYAGNLMSMLAVRIIPDPFDNLRDVLDHPSVVTVWREYSSNHQFIEVKIFLSPSTSSSFSPADSPLKDKGLSQYFKPLNLIFANSYLFLQMI